MTSPCVVGRKLAEAQQLLAAAGVPVLAVTETAPPRARRPQGPPRVVRQRTGPEGVSLVVAASIPLPEKKRDSDGSERSTE